MNSLFRAFAVLLPLLLSGCFSQESAPGTAPLGVTVTPGEGRVVLNWTSEPGLTYWVYYKAGSTVSKDDFTAIDYQVTAPTVITGLTNGTRYAFLVTASKGTSKTGPASDVQSTIPRLVGTTETWTQGTPLTANQLTGITYGSLTNKFVTVGAAATVFQATRSYSSPGGVSSAWSAATLPAGFVDDLSAVINDGAQFIALAANGKIITSTDAVTWTDGTAIGVIGMNALAYGGGSNYVAVGNNGVIYKSTSGVVTGAWTAKTSGTSQALYGVSYFSGVGYIAVGGAGTLLTSPDGETWTAKTSNTSNALRQVAFGAGAYVAVGDAGTVVHSTDTTTWTETIITAQNLRTVVYANGQFIAAGAAGTVAYSVSGQAGWTVGDAGVAETLNSIVPTDVLIAVGNAGVNVSVK